MIAVHTLVYLLHKGGCHSSSEIAINCQVNPVQVRRVISRFVKAGHVERTVGSLGGYTLKESGAKLNLREVSEICGAHFISQHWNTGNKDLDCPIARGMSGFSSKLISKMDEQLRTYLENFTIEGIKNELVNE